MIEAKTKKSAPHRDVSVHVRGSVFDLAEDMLYILRTVYRQIREEDAANAELFSRMISAAVNGAFGFQLWTETDGPGVATFGIKLTGDEAHD